MFYFILFCIVLFSYEGYRMKQPHLLWLTAILLYSLFALEYDTTNDYMGYLSRFYVAIGEDNSMFVNNMSVKEKIEPFYKFLMQISAPLGFFGFCLLLSFFNVSVLWKWIKELIPLKYLWLFFLIFICNPNYCLLLINSKRQALAICVILLGAYILTKRNNSSRSIIQKIKSLPSLIFLLTIILAGNIHFSAYAGILYYPIILFKPNHLNKPVIYTLLILFWITFYIHIDITSFASSLLEEQEKYIQYLQEIKSNNTMTLIYTAFDFIALALVLHYYDIFKSNEKIFAIAFTLSIISSHFLTDTIGRIMLPFTITIPFVLTYTLRYIKNYRVKIFFLVYLLGITMRWFYNAMATGEGYYEKWNHMKTIFEAPGWL